MRVTLLEDQKTISEVVVIGYGVQKKIVVSVTWRVVDTAPMVATCGDGRVAVMFFLCFFSASEEEMLENYS